MPNEQATEDREGIPGEHQSGQATLLDWLGQHRHLLLATFLLAECCFLALVLTNTIYVISEGLHAAFGGESDLEVASIELTRDPILIGLAVVYVALQLVLLGGMGGVRILGSGGVPLWKRVVNLMVLAVPASMLVLGLLFSALEFGDRAGAHGRQREVAFRGMDLTSGGQLLWMLLAMWGLWLLVGLLLIRHLDRPNAFGRIVCMLLAGSWIEFLVALPIDLAARPRNSECPCTTGSYLALCIAVPVMVWTTGPALFLIYLREARLSAASPRRSRKIVRAKGRREKSA